jgi:hypothetical protein
LPTIGIRNTDSFIQKTAPEGKRTTIPQCAKDYGEHDKGGRD